MIRTLLLAAVVSALILGVADAMNRGRGGGGGSTTFSPDGAFIEGVGATFSPVTGSSASLVNPYGVWTLGQYRTDLIGHWCVDPMQPVHNGCSSQYELFLNGHRINQHEEFVGPAFGGFMYYSGFDQNMTVWVNWGEAPNNGCYWDHTTCTGPESNSFPNLPAAPTWPPVSTATPPDGTFIMAPTGTISNEYGVWSWGPAASGGGYRVLLNGTYTWNDDTQGNGIQLQVNSNGLMFIQQPDTSWRVIIDYFRVGSNAPTGQAIPLRVNMLPTVSPVTLPCGDLIYRSQNTGPAGAIVGYLRVPMSDGSNFAGTVSVTPSNGIILFNATVLGDGTIELTTRQTPLYGLDNYAGVQVAVSQNGVTLYNYSYWYDMSDCTSRQ